MAKSGLRKALAVSNQLKEVDGLHRVLHCIGNNDDEEF